MRIWAIAGVSVVLAGSLTGPAEALSNVPVAAFAGARIVIGRSPDQTVVENDCSASDLPATCVFAHTYTGAAAGNASVTVTDTGAVGNGNAVDPEVRIDADVHDSYTNTLAGLDYSFEVIPRAGAVGVSSDADVSGNIIGNIATGTQRNDTTVISGSGSIALMSGVNTINTVQSPVFFSGNTPFTLMNYPFHVNQIYQLALDASILITQSRGDEATSFVAVDPAIALTGPDAAGYQVIYSPGLVASGTPEPAAWALLVAGFGGIGAALRRHRAAATA